MKKLVCLLVLLAAAAAVWADFPKPNAEITRFEVEAISLRDVTFLFELTVKNPYPVDLSFDGMTLDFSVEGSKVFSVASQGGFKVKAKKEKANTFTVTLAYEAIIKLVKDYVSKDWLQTVINGTLVIPLPKMPGLPQNITFKYKLEKKIPAIKPRVAVIDFEVQPPSAEDITKAVSKSGKKADSGKVRGMFQDLLAGKKPEAAELKPADIDVPLTVNFTIEISNEAKAPLSFDKLGYEMSVNGEKLVTGDTSSVVKEAGRTLVTIKNVFSSKQLSENIKALFTKHQGSFGVIGKASIKLPDEIRKEPIPLAFNEGGDFSVK